MATGYHSSLKLRKVYRKREKMLLSPILKNVEGIKTKVLQVAEESGGRDENIVPVFSVS